MEELGQPNRPRMVIPVGPRFQVVVPDWTGLPNEYSYSGETESDTKWLGTKIWPIVGESEKTKENMIGKGRPNFCQCESPESSSEIESDTKQLGTKIWPTVGESEKTKENMIGKGRPSFCQCKSPESVECIKRHITDKRIELQFDLGPAFWSWKFDEMGEEVSKQWTPQEQITFEHLVKMNPLSQGKSFLKPALERFQSKKKENIVSYYFNVYVPRRISTQTRAGCKIIDTDDEDEAEETLNSKVSRKRNRTDSATSCSSLKHHYLTRLR